MDDDDNALNTSRPVSFEGERHERHNGVLLTNDSRMQASKHREWLHCSTSILQFIGLCERTTAKTFRMGLILPLAGPMTASRVELPVIVATGEVLLRLSPSTIRV